MRLAKEMDIKNIILNLRNIRNMMQFTTTRGERRLNKMQADKNVIMITQKDKDILEKFIERPTVDTG